MPATTPQIGIKVYEEA